MKFLKRLWGDKVSLILLIVSVFVTIGYFTKELNLPGEAVLVLYIMFQVNEKGRFFDKLRDEYSSVAAEIGISPESYSFPKTIFSWIVNGIIFLGTVGLLCVFAYKLIF